MDIVSVSFAGQKKKTDTKYCIPSTRIMYSFSGAAGLLQSYAADSTDSSTNVTTQANDTSQGSGNTEADKSSETSNTDNSSSDVKNTDNSNDASAKDATDSSSSDQSSSQEVTYPKMELSGSANGIDVSIYAPEGALPDGTTVDVSSVSDSTAEAIVKKAISDGQSVQDAKAVDITFHDKGGTKIEPKSEISVKFSGADVSGDSHAIYHETSSGDVEKVKDINSGDGGTITSKEFSIYVIGGTGETAAKPRITYNFHNGDTTVNTQIVKFGDTLEKPAAPTKDGYSFEGWFTAPTGGDKFDTFGMKTGTRSQGGHRQLRIR